jgi:hypothetical protein
MKILNKASLIIMLLAALLPRSGLAQENLDKVTFNISPKTINTLATWEIGFTVPKETQLGYILVSLAGFQPDLSQAQLTVSGLPAGTASLGKTNTSCISNCDDIRYYFSDLVTVKAGTEVKLTLTNVRNPSKAGETGINFINLFKSKYPNLDLVLSANDFFIEIADSTTSSEEVSLPETLTSEKPQKINEVMINELFYQTSAQTTRLTAIKDPTKVEDFTLDLKDKVKVVFTAPLDLSQAEAIHYLANLADFMTFDYLYFWVAPELMDYFKAPLELTFYNLPFVWEPDIIKDNAFVLDKSQIDNLHSAIVDNKPRLSFIIKEAGGYNLVPHLELSITDNQQIKSANNYATFTGRISDPKANLKIFLNNQELTEQKPKIDIETGEFEFKANLTTGNNLIEVKAESEYGQIPTASKIVNYQPLINTNGQTATTITGISPLYYLIFILGFFLVILLGAIIYLVRKRK